MTEKPDASQNSLEAGPEQVLYSKILSTGMLIGMGLLLLTFLIYVSGIIDPYIPHSRVIDYSKMNIHDYLRRTEIQGGWSWIYMLRYSEFLNFIGIALLAGVTVICYVSIVPILLKNNDRVYAIIAIVEVLILAFAASGLLKVGH